MQKTIYYPEDLPVRTGDVVWNNEGVNVRKVISIVTEEEAKHMFVADGVTDGAGFFWSRYIGESDLGILGFESKKSFEEEGVGKLSRPELLCVKFLFHLLGKQIGLNIWDNKDYLYYPVLWRRKRKMKNMNGYGICFSNRITHQSHRLMKNNAFGLMNIHGILKK